jgi:hypothetical protein
MASPSMFAYCTEVLHLSEAEAYVRIAAARASREHPVLLEMLADGRLHLTAIARLAPHLTTENRDTLLERAAHKTKRQIEELVAELAPRPDVPAMMRKVPTPQAPPASAISAGSEAPASLRPWPDGVAAAEDELRPDAVASAHLGSARTTSRDPRPPTGPGRRSWSPSPPLATRSSSRLLPRSTTSSSGSVP